MVRRWRVAAVLLVAAVACSWAWAESASVLLEKGVYLEETSGDTDGAVAVYKQIIQDPEAGRRYVAEAYYRLATCYLKKGQTASAVESFQALMRQFPDQQELVARAAAALDRIVTPDPAGLMPAETFWYVEVGSPGKQVQTIVDMLKDTPLANPLAAVGAQAGGGPVRPGARSPAAVLGALLNPSMIEEFKKVRGMAIGVYGLESPAGRGVKTKAVAVLYPGNSDVLRGFIRAGIEMAGQPTQPIEGMQAVMFGPSGEGGCVFDDNAMIFATSPEQLARCVRQYKGLAEEPSLLSANQAFAALPRQERQESALTVWLEPARLTQLVESILPDSRDAKRFQAADAFLDFSNMREAFGRLVLDARNPFVEATVALQEGHQCLAYNMLRTPNLTAQAFQALPPEAVGVLGFALGPAESAGGAQAEAARSAVRQLSGLDIGRELFGNIEQVCVFLLPPGHEAEQTALAQRTSPALLGLGLAVTSRDPGQTRQLLGMLLKAVDAGVRAAGRPQAEQPEEVAGRYRVAILPYRDASGARQEVPAFVYLGQAGKTTALALSPQVLEACLKAANQGRSAVTEGPLRPLLDRLPAHSSKVLLANVGGLIQLNADQMSRATAQSPQQVQLLSQMADLFAQTGICLTTAETPNQLRARLEISQLPPMGSLFPIWMQLMGTRGRLQATSSLQVEPGGPEPGLQSAAAEGNLEQVKSLVEKGADVNSADTSQGWTALHWAVSRGHRDVAQYLLEKGARKDVLIAAGTGDWAFIEAKLAEDPALLGYSDLEKNNMLHWAERGDQPEMARKLLERGVDPNSTNVWGGHVLLYAARESRTEVARVLVTHGADVNILAGGSGLTALHEAVMKGNNELVQILLAHGANPNLATSDGRTPLALARETGNAEIIQELKNHAATE